MDGVAFELVNIAGTRRINFYSGKVEPLGISAFASALGAAAVDDGRPDLVAWLVESASSFPTEGFARRVRQLVGYVIVTAKRKDRRAHGNRCAGASRCRSAHADHRPVSRRAVCSAAAAR